MPERYWIIKIDTMRKVNMETYLSEPDRYELRSGIEPDAPACPYGNRFEWIGYDKISQEYLRFTKSVFKKLIQQKENK